MSKKTSKRKVLTPGLATQLLDELGSFLEDKKEIDKEIKDRKEQLKTFLDMKGITDFSAKLYHIDLQEKSDRKESSILFEEATNLCDLTGLHIDEILDKEYCLIKDRNYFQKIGEPGIPFLESFWKPREPLMVIKEVHKK